MMPAGAQPTPGVILTYSQPGFRAVGSPNLSSGFPLLLNLVLFDPHFWIVCLFNKLLLGSFTFLT